MTPEDVTAHIKKVEITLGKQELAFTMEEAKKLHELLGSIFTKTPFFVPLYQPPWPPYPYWEYTPYGWVYSLPETGANFTVQYQGDTLSCSQVTIPATSGDDQSAGI